MDLLEVLLLALFLLVPLLHGIFTKKKPPQPLELPDDEPEEWEIAPAPRSTRPAGAEGGWSGGWGAWPGAESEDEDEDRGREEERVEELLPVLREDRPVERIVIAPVSSPSPHALPEAISLEPLQVDRKREHERLHQRFAAAQPPPPAAPRLASSHALLRHPDDVRRAILLAEVLGPPRALRPHADEPAVNPTRW